MTGWRRSSPWDRFKRAPRCVTPAGCWQMPLGLVDRIAKLIPNPPGKSISLREAVDSEPRLQQIAEQEPLAQRLFEITEKIEGPLSPRLHPSGRRGDRRPAAG